MTYDDVEILTDQEVKGIYNDVYNSFWRRYYQQVPDPQSEEWEQIVEQEKQLREKYKNFQFYLRFLKIEISIFFILLIV